MMRVAAHSARSGHLGGRRVASRAAWLGSVVSLTLAACTVSPSALERDDMSESERRAHAYRHVQLALAYLGHARADVADTEVTAALTLAPGDASVHHAAALVAVAREARDAALMHFAAAVAAVDREWDMSNTTLGTPSSAASDGGPAPARAARAMAEVGPLQGRERRERGMSPMARTTLADARTLWSNYAQALCAEGDVAQAAFFLRRAGKLGVDADACAGVGSVR